MEEIIEMGAYRDHPIRVYENRLAGGIVITGGGAHNSPCFENSWWNT